MNAISNPPWSTLAKQMRELSLRILSIRDSIGYSKKLGMEDYNIVSHWWNVLERLVYG